MSEVLAAPVVQQNLRLVLQRIKEACQRFGRADSPRLVAVGKTFPASQTRACYEAGQRHFGENYVQELAEKAAELKDECSEIRWHFIGNIQSNKIKKIAEVPNLWCVETLSSEQHCAAFQRQMEQLDRRLNVFVQVNTSGEANKGGLEPDEVEPLVRFLQEHCPNLHFLGLMTIGSQLESSDPDKNADFERLVQLREQLCERLTLPTSSVELSMGMSGDFALAIGYGSTNVRVGSTIFGARHYPQKS